MSDLESIILPSFGTLQGAEVVSPGHPDLLAAYLASTAREVIEKLQGELGVETIRSDLKAFVGAHHENGGAKQVITVDGNIDWPEDLSLIGGEQQVYVRLEKAIRDADRMYGGWDSTHKENIEVDFNILGQEEALSRNASKKGNHHTMPRVWGDTVYAVAGANLDTPERVSAPIVDARKINESLCELVRTGKLIAGYDGKVHVVGEMDRDSGIYRGREIHIAKQHDKNGRDGKPQDLDYLRMLIDTEVLGPFRGSSYGEATISINTAGAWPVGGTHADMGEGCDHIFWANHGYQKSADPQVGEDPSKGDGLEFMMRALAKTTLELLKDKGAYEVIAHAKTRIGESKLSMCELEVRDKYGKMMYTAQERAGLIRTMFQEGLPDNERMFPIQAQNIMRSFSVPASTFSGLLLRGNVYGYTPEDARGVPWEDVTPRVLALRPAVTKYINSLN